MEKKIRKIGLMMNILMGLSLSFALSLIGCMNSGHFALVSWLICFAGSFILSLIIGFCLPVRKCAIALCSKCGLKERSIGSLFMESLVSDVFYTPIITLFMIAFAYKGAKRAVQIAVEHGAPADLLTQIEFLPMFLRGLAVSMLAGYILISLLQPLFLKMLLKNQNHPSDDAK